jgi:soluble lytic murein transglycosylase
MQRFSRHAAKVSPDALLYPYIAYWRVARNLQGDAAIADFLAANPDTWLAERLRSEWLRDLGRRELWPAYVAEYPRLAKPETTHQCLARRAELAVGDRRGLRDAIAMWFTGRDMPTACTPLFAWLIEQGYLSEEDAWKRLRLAFAAGNTGVAKSVATAIAEERRPHAASIDRVVRDPAGWLASVRVDWAARPQRELGLAALGQLARKDTVEAARRLEPVLPALGLPDQQYISGVLATEAARNHEPQALSWFERTGGIGLHDSQREWWARAALRAGDWRAVERAIVGMSDAARGEPAWRYWLGRALKANGQPMAANQILAPLSREHHYYGQLAEEELGVVMGAPTPNIKITDAEVEAARRDPGIARALALHDLDLRTDAANEWSWAIRNMGDRQLLAAAELARRNDWHDRAINTAEKTRELHDFDLRFIAPYRELASREAREHELDEAWVFGLIRQESRFLQAARSRAGASGLMQIMPATARWIAKRLGMSGFTTSSLSEPATNLKFGAYYLRYVLNALDGHPVLATAAYNAGPRRAQRWRDSKPVEGAIYVESIPFSETRAYVKKVMSNAMYYARRFNQPSVLLRDRLGIIPARSVAAVPAGEEDGQPAMEADNGGS